MRTVIHRRDAEDAEVAQPDVTVLVDVVVHAVVVVDALVHVLVVVLVVVGVVVFGLGSVEICFYL